MASPRRRRTLVGTGYLLAGAGALGLALWVGTPPDWAWWAVFTAASVTLSYLSVEVNDRLFISSSVMALFTGGVVFALDTGSAVLGMALMSALEFLSPEDLRERRVFQPASNFGQLTASAVLAGLTIDAVLGGIGTFDPARSDHLLLVAAAGLAGALVYTVLNFVAVIVGVRAAHGTRNLLPWSQMGFVVGAQVLMGSLGGLLGGILVATNESLVPLVLLIFVVAHWVYSAYAQVRRAHESTLRGFVKILEAQDLYTRGHTERVAYFSRLIGEELGLGGNQLERLRFAALIHDVGKLAVPREIIRKQGEATDGEYRELRRATHRVDDLLAEVDFLRPMVEIASGYHPRLSDEDFGQKGHRHGRIPTVEQQVLAVADAFDAITCNRNYRMAMSQPAALDTLRRDDSPLFRARVVDALDRGLARVGEQYGPRTVPETVIAGAARD